MKKLLFLCTGNYYRSRFAEEYFNHLAFKLGLRWKADSKGLSLNMPNPKNPGPISEYAINALQERKIPGRYLSRYPQPVKKYDFETYDKIIALSEIEHRPMLENRFNHHANHVSYFEVDDQPFEDPDTAMSNLSYHIEHLIEKIK